MPVYPVKLPDSMRDVARKGAEIALYYLLRQNLPDNYTAIYNVEWLCKHSAADIVDPYTKSRLNPTEYPIGETDFILASSQGVLVLEVKGGSVFIEKGTWYSMDREGRSHEIENPLNQARRNMFALISSLGGCPGFRNRFVPFGYAVVLGQTEIWPEEIPDQRLFIFEEQVGNELIGRLQELQGYWRHLWQEYRGKQLPGLESGDLAKIVELFAPTTSLRKRPARAELDQFKEEVFELTENQLDVLKCRDGNRKAVITGGAGTGKSLLAMEKARKISGLGYKTLFTCPNRMLAKYVNLQLQKVENLDIMNFHSLCYQWGKKAGIGDLIDPDHPGVKKIPFDYYRKTLPEVLFDAAHVIDDKYEAIIVDEAQEMESLYWTALQSCLAEDEAVFYIFCDPTQAIWHHGHALPFQEPTFRLYKNLRNSRKVFSQLQKLCAEPGYEAGCTNDGEFEAIVLTEDENLLIRLEKLLGYLVNQGFSLKEIAIVTGKSRDTSELAAVNNIGSFKLTSDLYNTEDRVLFSSARRFRGMEAMAVIMVEVDYIVDLEKLKSELGDRFKYGNDQEMMKNIATETLLIGMSRAQHSLYMVVDRKTLEDLKGLGLNL